MIKPKIQLIVFLFSIILFPPVWVQADDDDGDRRAHRKLQQQINNLQHQIDDLPPSPFDGNVVAHGRVASSGQVIYDGTENFTIQHPEGRLYLITLNEPMDCVFNPSINMYFAKGTIVATNIFFGQGFIVAQAIPKSTFDDCSNNPVFQVSIGLETGGWFHFLIAGDTAPTS